MDNMIDCATTFLLAPGVAQIFYGDETGRKLSDARFNVDADQAFRSDMDWNDIDSTLLAHYRCLGQIRRDNPAIGTGRQRTIDTHTCLRSTDNGDTLLIKLRPADGRPIPVADIFPDGTNVTELYTGQTATVHNTSISFPRYKNKIAILKRQE